MAKLCYVEGDYREALNQFSRCESGWDAAGRGSSVQTVHDRWGLRHQGK